MNNRDLDDYRRSMEDLDPDVVEARRLDDDRAKRRAGLIRSQGERDQRELMKSDAFRRFMFTVLAKSGMYAATRHAQDRDYAYDAGRRALGLELLNDALGIDPKFAIDLSMEQAKLEEHIARVPDPE